ncbi:MAG: hypothetical protein IPI58_03690 [Alphaproteobacteria bacterium]|nr:MAG: hypothetical protein IPI58_03690 [Alphaproteobacteria bacterium]
MSFAPARPQEKIHYSPIAVGDDRGYLRDILARAFRAARDFDNSDASIDALTEALAPFDNLALERGKDSALNRDAVESSLSRHARGPGHKPVTVSDLLDLAMRNFARRLNNDTVSFITFQTDLEFLPTHGQKPIQTGSGAGMDSIRLEPRLNQVLLFLAQNDISTSDYRVLDGVLDPKGMRRRGYRIVQIPRLDREIAVCDQAGQAIYVAQGQPGPLFWASYSKEQLRHMPHITRVAMDLTWQDRLAAAVLSDNPPRPKTVLSSAPAFPLTEGIILTHALLWARDHDGKLPHDKSGDIPGMSGQTWTMWSKALTNQRRGLTREGCKGLSHLFNIYGLKKGKKEVPEVIEPAIMRMNEGQQHGLTEIDDVPETGFRVTEDLILTHALLWARDHDGKLPATYSGDIPGMSGQNWGMWTIALRCRNRGLTREGCKGLNHLFNIYGLKIGRKEAPEKIAEAIGRINEGQPHGLTETNASSLLTEEIILTHALLWARDHDGILPSNRSGDIPGMSGQNWGMWRKALTYQRRGLTREGCKGLSHLFNIYGLKIEQKEVPEKIAEAIGRIDAGLPHGLVPSTDSSPARPQGRLVPQVPSGHTIEP